MADLGTDILPVDNGDFDGDTRFPLRLADTPGWLYATVSQIAMKVGSLLFGSLVGQAGKAIIVNGTEDGFEFGASGGGGGGGGGGEQLFKAGGVFEFSDAGAVLRMDVEGCSITRIAAGRYRIDFDTSMPNADYGVLATGKWTTQEVGNYSAPMVGVDRGYSPHLTEDFFYIVSEEAGGTNYDSRISFAVYESAAKLTAASSGGGSGGSGKLRGAFLYKSAPQAVNVNDTQIYQTFDLEMYDSEGVHDTVTNNDRITIPSSLGEDYYVNVWVRWARTVDRSTYNIMWLFHYSEAGTLLNTWRFDLRTFESTIFNNGETRFIPAVPGEYFRFAVQTGNNGGDSAAGISGTVFGCEFMLAPEPSG